MKNRIFSDRGSAKAISDLICMNLEVAGYETAAVRDGQEAEYLLKNHKFLNRSGIGGYHAARERWI